MFIKKKGRFSIANPLERLTPTPFKALFFSYTLQNIALDIEFLSNLLMRFLLSYKNSGILKKEGT